MNIILASVLTLAVRTSSYSDEYFDNNSNSFYGEEGSDFSSYDTQYLPLAGEDFKSWQIKTLEYINMLREKGNIPALEMDEKLTTDVQVWAQKVACKGTSDRQDVKGLQARNFKIDLQHKYKSPSSRSKTELLHKTLSDWFNESKDFNCSIPITLDDTYSGADNFQKVGHYAIIMGKQYERVGFGVAACEENDSVLIIARFDYDIQNFNQMVIKELENQKLSFNEKDQLDVSKFVACPNDFNTS